MSNAPAFAEQGRNTESSQAQCTRPLTLSKAACPNVAELAQRLRDVGLLVEHIEFDGKLHRCPTADKPRKKNGAYIAYPDSPVTIWWQDWATNAEGTFTAKSRERWTPAERKAFDKRLEATNAARVADERQRHAEAAKKARCIWERCTPVEGNAHPYLEAKGVLAHGIRKSLYNGEYSLVIPVLDASGEVQSLQFIPPNGEKRFKTDAKKKVYISM